MLRLNILAGNTGPVRIRHWSPHLRESGAAQASELQGRCRFQDRPGDASLDAIKDAARHRYSVGGPAQFMVQFGQQVGQRTVVHLISPEGADLGECVPRTVSSVQDNVPLMFRLSTGLVRTSRNSFERPREPRGLENRIVRPAPRHRSGNGYQSARGQESELGA